MPDEWGYIRREQERQEQEKAEQRHRAYVNAAWYRRLMGGDTDGT